MKFELIGSSQIVAAAAAAMASHHRRSQAGPGSVVEVRQTSRPVSTITVDTTSSTSVKAVIATLAVGRCIHANGQNTMAASGG